MFRMISITSMRNCTWPFNGLAAGCSGTKGFVSFMIMVFAERSTIINIEDFVWEGFIASEAIEAIFVIFPLELAVRRRHCLFFYGKITSATLGKVHILPTPLTEDPLVLPLSLLAITSSTIFTRFINSYPPPVLNPLAAPHTYLDFLLGAGFVTGATSMQCLGCSLCLASRREFGHLLRCIRE
jgi:hypothetical protein